MIGFSLFDQAFVANLSPKRGGAANPLGAGAFESFSEYSASNNLNGLNGGFGWGGAWTATNTTIVSKTVGDETGNRASIANGYIVRPHGQGNDWTRMRIGVRLQMNNTAANLTNPSLFVGLCSGTSSAVGATTPLFGLGHWRVNETWTYAGASGGNMTRYVAGNGNGWGAVAGRVVNGTQNLYRGCNDGSDTSAFGADDTAPSRRMFFVNIKKSGNNFVQPWAFYPNGIAESPDVTQADFITQMKFVGVNYTNTFSNHRQCYTDNSTAYVTNANPLDCVNIWWNFSTPQIQILEIAAYVLS